MVLPWSCLVSSVTTLAARNITNNMYLWRRIVTLHSYNVLSVSTYWVFTIICNPHTSDHCHLTCDDLYSNILSGFINDCSPTGWKTRVSVKTYLEDSEVAENRLYHVTLSIAVLDERVERANNQRLGWHTHTHTHAVFKEGCCYRQPCTWHTCSPIRDVT